MRKLLLPIILPFAALGAQAATYTYTPAGTNTLWSNTANWSNGIATGAGYPSTSSDVANVGVSSGDQTVTYDSAASGTIGTLNMANTGAGTNLVDIQRVSSSSATATIFTNAVTLGSTTGFNTVLVDATAPNASGNSAYITAPSFTLNTGGVLELHPFANASNGNGIVFNGNLAISGGTFNIDQNQSAAGQGLSSIQNTITGTLSMSSGNIVFSKVVTPITSGNLITADNRLVVSGNVTMSGGTISVAAGTGTAVANQANSGNIFFGGATNVLNGVNGLTSVSLTFSRGGTTPASSFTTDQIVGAVNERLGATNGVLTLKNTNTSATGNIGQLGFIGQVGAVSSTETVLLASNLTTTTLSTAQAIVAAGVTYTAGSTPNFILDLGGYTYDLTRTPTFTPTNPSTAATTSFTFQSTTGTGTVRAVGYNFASAASVGAAATTVGANVTLESTGGNGQANNLGTTAGTVGTISPASTFLYTGNAARNPVAGGSTGTEATLLSSNRNIGMLQVQNGALNINQASLTAGGAVSVTNAGTLDIYGTSTGLLTLASGNFTASGAVLELTLLNDGTRDVIAAGGTGQSFSLSDITIALNGTPNSASTYAVFTGFTGNTASNVAFTGAPSGFTASLDTNGVISFAAVPEPSEVIQILVGGSVLAIGIFVNRRRQRAPQA